MQFIQHGPDIPDVLLQAQEEGRVVFFCGAGISYSAGLPGFAGLVDAIYSTVGTVPSEIEKKAIGREQFDAALDLLEQRLPGQRAAVRAALAKVLKPNLRKKGASDTHAALLELARTRDSAVRLVTTNFDRIFQHLMDRAKPTIPGYPAPLLPIPKNTRWNGVVYLHGLLPKQPEESALNRLVLTSGDFGLAYLTERWAARFVSELFRNYVVCFVGYSINDPVLRYMMDALASDRRLGEVTPQAYALGDCEPEQKRDKKIEWEAKGVTPILYEVPAGTQNHSALHRTLKAWSETYRDGIQGKERIVVEYAMTRPSASTRQDDFVGRMLWALSHDSGLPAKRFAEFNPVASLDWLEAFAENSFGQTDLIRFGVPPRTAFDSNLKYSLTHRPAAYTLAPPISFASGGVGACDWDEVMLQLARWLVRHLNDPELILYLARRGGVLHDRLVRLIETKLDELVRLEQDGNTTELDRIRANSPNAIPQPLMRTLWRLLITGRAKSSSRGLDLYHWKDRLHREGLTSTIRLELRELLTPRVSLTKPFRWGKHDDPISEPQKLKELVDWELVLTADHVHSLLDDFRQSKTWQLGLPKLVEDFQQLLRDALDLMNELGDANVHHDRSYLDLPSITPHWQNRRFHDWATLIELLRDSWVAVHQIDPVRARHIAHRWLEQPYLTFRRLTLFAATHEAVAPNGEWVDWLLADGGWWLWSVETKRETMRLLVLQGAKLPDVQRSRLEACILGGPPRDTFPAALAPEKLARHTDRMVWLRLAKLESGASPLGNDARAYLSALSEKYPEWRLAENERDEFSHWMSGTGDPDYQDRREVDQTPRTRRDLVKWLQQEKSNGFSYENTWREICRTRFFHSAFALCDLSRINLWPTAEWSEAFHVWGDDNLVLRAWRFIAPLIIGMPDQVLLEIEHSLTWWLQIASKVIDRHEANFLNLCRRILELPRQDNSETDEPVTQALNHPVGQVTQALLYFWFRRELNDGDGLPKDLEPLFTLLFNAEEDKSRHGQVMLAAHLITLFRVDRAWTETHLLPLFDWQASPDEARALWEGFLWAPRLYRPLLIAFKSNFLESARHYAELGTHGSQYAAFLTYAALESVETYTTNDFRIAISALPSEGLRESAQALVNALEGSGAQIEQYWVNRIQPFWQTIWPKSRELASNLIAEIFARLSILARGEFPAALSTLRDWLKPLEYPYSIVSLLLKSDLCARFPRDVLQLLDSVIGNESMHLGKLEECLNAISQAWPGALQDSRYRRLNEYARRHGTQ